MIQITQLASPYWIPPFGGALNYLGFAKDLGVLSNFLKLITYGFLFGGASSLWLLMKANSPPKDAPPTSNA
jgi:hypothetical protein